MLTWYRPSFHSVVGETSKPLNTKSGNCFRCPGNWRNIDFCKLMIKDGWKSFGWYTLKSQQLIDGYHACSGLVLRCHLTRALRSTHIYTHSYGIPPVVEAVTDWAVFQLAEELLTMNPLQHVVGRSCPTHIKVGVKGQALVLQLWATCCTCSLFGAKPQRDLRGSRVRGWWKLSCNCLGKTCFVCM